MPDELPVIEQAKVEFSAWMQRYFGGIVNDAQQDAFADKAAEIFLRTLAPTASWGQPEDWKATCEAERRSRTAEREAIWNELQRIAPWSESNDMDWIDEIMCGLAGVQQRLEESESLDAKLQELSAMWQANPNRYDGRDCGVILSAVLETAPTPAAAASGEVKRGRYRKKPIVIEAVQWDGHNDAPIKAFCDSFSGPFEDRTRTGLAKPYLYLRIATTEGAMRAEPGDWIIKGIKGEFYPCKPDIFEATYESADSPATPSPALAAVRGKIGEWRKRADDLRANTAEAYFRGKASMLDTCAAELEQLLAGATDGQGNIGDLPARVLAMCKARKWSLHWTARGAYLHLESSELIEAIRGKHGNSLCEAADVLLVLMSITESNGIDWTAVVEQASSCCDELMATADKPYAGEQREIPAEYTDGQGGTL